MKLFNTLTKHHDLLTPYNPMQATIYSCGPTVYDHAHIGNLSAYIFADTLRRVLASELPVLHAMNYTDVDDKTIRRSHDEHPELEPMAALTKLTEKYIAVFLKDMVRIGNDVDAITFLKATENIDGMKQLITQLHRDGFAYIAEDGIYFSIEAYKKTGKIYGQLLEITTANTSEARIQNDEYDKESAHDFALWKKQKPGEPAWEFMLDGHDLTGRPGWHVECSVMSKTALGQPFDIHTGGVDLIFPHHENEIAQSTAGHEDRTMAQIFAHNEHILVNGKKMSKSAQNFFTLENIVQKGINPLAFRLLVLQAHYRNQVNFTFESLSGAEQRLKRYQNFAALRFQGRDNAQEAENLFAKSGILEALQEDLDTPRALVALEAVMDTIEETFEGTAHNITALITQLDRLFGLQLLSTADITNNQKTLLAAREAARAAKDWAESDKIRDELLQAGIGIRDTPSGTVWYRL
jgi:cysteinyl-tRNA synthetase